MVNFKGIRGWKIKFEIEIGKKLEGDRIIFSKGTMGENHIITITHIVRPINA